MKIALAGNPNSGKTTMYNALTGRSEKVGNWAGVTVEKKESHLKRIYYSGKEEISVVDLPGAYSMSPFTSEESVTSTYIKNESPDVIINIVDSTNLSRSLFFTTQLLELGIPTVIALNKSDINDKKHNKIDTEKLSELLSCPVVSTASTSAEGLTELAGKAIALKGSVQSAPYVEDTAWLLDKKSAKEADRRRFAFVNNVVKSVEKREFFTNKKNINDKIDAYLTNKWLGIPIFALVMFLVFDISQSTLGPLIADTLVEWLEIFKEFMGGLFSDANPLLYALLIDGVIGGFIAVVGFLPLVMVMYFLIALLEDCGYMARVSVVLDPIFKKVGLSGKSVIPFVITTGCAVPGVMASRTIKNERERRATAMLAPFMPCGAKLPVISLFAGVFFADASWVGTLMYFAGILIIFFGALLVNKITGRKKKKSYFIMELPEYKIPSFLRAFQSMCSRGWSYVVKAGTVILVCNTVVHIMQSFNLHFELIDESMAHTSILAFIAEPFAYVLIPIIGFRAWQLAAAAVTGFIAKENVVGTIAVCYGITNFIDMDALALSGGANEVALTIGLSKAAALAYLMFNLFTPPCFAAIGAMSSEMKSAKWLWAGIGLQFATGFTVSYFVYQIGTYINTGSVGAGFVPGLIAVIAIAVIIALMIANTNKKVKAEEAEKAARKAQLSAK